jgi:hypothetical protein
MRQIRSAIGATTIDPELITAAERLQYEGYLRREEANATILGLSKGGMPIKQIVRQTGHGRGLVRQVMRGERHDVFRTGRVLSISTCHGSTINGQPVAETALNFGDAYGRAVSEAPFVLSANERLVDGGPKD